MGHALRKAPGVIAVLPGRGQRGVPFLNGIPGYLSRSRTLVVGIALTGGRIAAEFFGGLVLMLSSCSS